MDWKVSTQPCQELERAERSLADFSLYLANWSQSANEASFKEASQKNEKERNNLLPLSIHLLMWARSQPDLHLLDKPGQGSFRVWHQERVSATPSGLLQGYRIVQGEQDL